MRRRAGRPATRRMNQSARGEGLYVLLVGPDGSGKSSLAPRLVDFARRDGRLVRHMHWRPGMLPQRATLTGANPDPSRPHAGRAHGSIVSLVRLAYYWIDFYLGLHVRVQPMRARGGVAVMERGWWDFAVDPLRYRLKASRRLVELLGKLLPPPDLIVLLETTPKVLTERKQELPAHELARQIRLWKQIDLPKRSVRVRLDASQDLDVLASEAEGHMSRLLGIGGANAALRSSSRDP
jgi:thymidylate kinase